MRQFFIGGARSGKSRLAEAEALAWPGEVIYLATAQVGDEEFAQRVAAHRARRPAQWGLIEAPASLAQALNAAAAPERLLLVDCLTLWLVGFLTADGVDEARWRQERAALLQLLPQLPGKIVLVSNEIGWGVVPMGAATRWFVDELGWLNQAVARQRQRCLAAVARRQGQPAAAQFGAQGGFAGGKIKLRRIGHGARSRNENALCEQLTQGVDRVPRRCRSGRSS